MTEDIKERYWREALVVDILRTWRRKIRGMPDHIGQERQGQLVYLSVFDVINNLIASLVDAGVQVESVCAALGQTADRTRERERAKQS